MPIPHSIYINGRFLCRKATGVQKYALGLCAALQKLHPEIVIIAPNGHYDNCGLNVVKTGWGSGFFWEQLWLPLYLWFRAAPLLINLCNTAPILYKQQIVTIHDLAFLKDKTWFSKSFRRWYQFLIPRICKKALSIITVSDFIRKEIVSTYAIPENKIYIVSNSTPDMVFEEKSPCPFPYLFLTGAYNPRKKAAFILSLLPELKKKNYHVVCVGVEADIYGNVNFKNDEYLHLLNYVNDRQYYTLMKHAEALVFPSEYEGFGIPVLEALVLGTPVILPDIAVYRESFGEIPLYYKPGDANSFLQEVDKINIYKPTAKQSSFLKNKYNFTQSAEVISEIIKRSI